MFELKLIGEENEPIGGNGYGLVRDEDFVSLVSSIFIDEDNDDEVFVAIVDAEDVNGGDGKYCSKFKCEEIDLFRFDEDCLIDDCNMNES